MSKMLTLENKFLKTHAHLDFFDSSRKLFKREIKKALFNEHQHHNIEKHYGKE